MKQRYIPGVVNMFEVSDPNEIKALAKDPVVDRQFKTPKCPVNWFILKRSLSALSFNGHRFPTMEPKGCQRRAKAQDQLWSKLNEQVGTIKTSWLLWQNGLKEQVQTEK